MKDRRHRQISILASAAVIGLAPACTEALVVYDDSPVEIGLGPVANMSTKVISGAMEGTAYNGYETFAVFAYHKITEAGQTWNVFAGADGNTVTYLWKDPFCKRSAADQWWGGGYNDIVLTYNRDTSDPDYVKGTSYISTPEDEIFNTVAAEPQYWPKTGSLFFAGYSPYKTYDFSRTSGNDGTREYTPINAEYTIDEENGCANPRLTIKGFTQGSYNWAKDDHWAENETVDLMWFDVDDSWNRSQDAAAGAVPVTFRHACSWLDFNIRTTDPGIFSIYRVSLSYIYRQADFTSSNGDGRPEWSGRTAREDEIVLFEHDGQEDKDFVLIDGKGFFLGNLIIIPQSLTKTVNGIPAQSALTIEFSQNTTDGTPLVQTKTLSLTAGDGGEWETGKHYTYDITFGLDKIHIDPDIDDWKETGPSVTVD